MTPAWGWVLMLAAGAACVTTRTISVGAGGGGERFDLDRRLWRPNAVAELGLGPSMLIGSGVRSYEDLATYEAKLEATLRGILDAARANNAALPLHLKLHAAMHKVALHGGYQSQASSLTQVLDRGRYNCLSGSALYVLAARRAGVQATGYAMQGHIMALVFDQDGGHKVETTLKDQSNPALQDLVAQEESRLIPPELKGTVYDVSPEEMVAMFYWNRVGDSAPRHDMWENQVSYLTYLQLGPPKVAWRMLGQNTPMVRGSLLNQCVEDGCERCVDLVNQWIVPQRLGEAKPLLRDLRADCYEQWQALATPPNRCHVLQRAIHDDATHPRVQAWMETPAGRECVLRGQ